MLENQTNLTLFQQEAADLKIDGGRVVGVVTQSGVDTVMKALDSFEVFKERKVDAASTYDMTYVRQALKELKLP